jgi:hypothetical protein
MHQPLSTILVVLGLVIFSIVIIYIAGVVHRILNSVCVWHAERFCQRHGLAVSRVRWQVEFERRSDSTRGVKTENTLVQLDCLNDQKECRLVLLQVWPLGVRKLLSDEQYPESYDNQRPQQSA